jgi:biopolymer transport protein ExbB
MEKLIEGAGVFIYPLAVCSLLAIFILVERLMALRQSRVIPRDMVDAFIKGDIKTLEADESTVGGRILKFYREVRPDPEGLKAFAQLEVNRMERGLFVLDIVVGAAPLIGLLGTVTGLVQSFGNFSEETGMPDPSAFVQGVALALTTTILGLSIAIPAIVGNAFLSRRVESLAARLNVGVERLIDLTERAENPKSS